MKSLRQEVLAKINEIRDKAGKGETPDEKDLKALLLASLMEEEGHGSKK